MTTVVRHRRTNNQYILLGINGAEDKANLSRSLGELFSQEKSEVSYSATVCDERGNMFLANIDDLIVVEIDGVKPAEILPEASYEPYSNANRDLTNRSAVRDFDEDFDEDFDAEEENLGDEPTPESDFIQAPISGGDSLDAPNLEENDDEDWI